MPKTLKPDLLTVRALCVAIEAGYDAGKSGLDDDMIQHLIDLGDNAASIIAMIDTLADDEAPSESGGWGVFNGWQIQRCDDADVFADDAEAIAYVRMRAAEGSERHALVLACHEAGMRDEAAELNESAAGDPQVFHRDTMDDEHRALHPKATPWLLQEEDGSIEYFRTEGKACKRQRELRTARGLDPMTGDPA